MLIRELIGESAAEQDIKLFLILGDKWIGTMEIELKSAINSYIEVPDLANYQKIKLTIDQLKDKIVKVTSSPTMQSNKLEIVRLVKRYEAMYIRLTRINIASL